MHLLIVAETIFAGIAANEKTQRTLSPLVYSAATMLPTTLLFMNLTQINPRRIDFGLLQGYPFGRRAHAVCGLIYLYFHLAGGRKLFRNPLLILAVLSTLLLWHLYDTWHFRRHRPTDCRLFV